MGFDCLIISPRLHHQDSQLLSELNNSQTYTSPLQYCVPNGVTSSHTPPHFTHQPQDDNQPKRTPHQPTTQTTQTNPQHHNKNKPKTQSKTKKQTQK
jgi:hypothetical protein